MSDFDNELRNTFAHQVAPLDAQAPSPTYFRRIKRRKVVATLGSVVAAVGVLAVLVVSLGALLPLGNRDVGPGGDGAPRFEGEQTIVLPNLAITYPKAWFLMNHPDNQSGAFLQVTSRDDLDMAADAPTCPSQDGVTLWLLSAPTPGGTKPFGTPGRPTPLEPEREPGSLCSVDTRKASWFDPASHSVIVAVLRAGPAAPAGDVQAMEGVFDSLEFPTLDQSYNKSAFDGSYGSSAYFVAATGEAEGFGEFGVAVWNGEDGSPQTELGPLPTPGDTMLEPVMIEEEGRLLGVGVSSPVIARISIEAPGIAAPLASDWARPLPSSFFGQPAVVFALVRGGVLPRGSELVSYDRQGTELSRLSLDELQMGPPVVGPTPDPSVEPADGGSPAETLLSALAVADEYRAEFGSYDGFDQFVATERDSAYAWCWWVLTDVISCADGPPTSGPDVHISAAEGDTVILHAGNPFKRGGASCIARGEGADGQVHHFAFPRTDEDLRDPANCSE